MTTKAQERKALEQIKKIVEASELTAISPLPLRGALRSLRATSKTIGPAA